MKNSKLINGPWNLSDLPKNLGGMKVFSCFHCGGGSTMGYKLAGFDVLGGVEIDPKMMDIYKSNHKPKHSFLMGVEEFNKIPNKELPKELFELDILDGSPPCSSFSMAGSREKDWGKKKKFKEGQADQVLDDLFFHFIDTAKKLKPKVVIAENVKGLIIGNARGYVKEIFKAFDKAGYDTQLFLLDASTMGVPQKRQRVFFISKRRDLGFQSIKLEFNEPFIPVSEAFRDLKNQVSDESVSSVQIGLWESTLQGQSFSKAHIKGSWFNYLKLHPKRAAPTLIGSGYLFHWAEPRRLSPKEFLRLQTFPDDFNFKDQKVHYVCGMSVPPFMMQRIADQVAQQWFLEILEVQGKKQGKSHAR